MNKIKLSERELLCLKALVEFGNENEDGFCTTFKHIAELAGLNETQGRRSVRALVRKGLAEYHRGLFNEDGDVAGSGHCVSPAGVIRFAEETKQLPLA